MNSLEELVSELVSTGAAVLLLDGIAMAYDMLVDAPDVACEEIETESIGGTLEDIAEVGVLMDESVPIGPATLEVEYTEWVREDDLDWVEEGVLEFPTGELSDEVINRVAGDDSWVQCQSSP